MAIPQDYNDLIAEIANWLNRDDLNDDIPSFIKYAEQEINRVSSLSNQETLSTVLTVAGQEYSLVPTGFKEIISLIYSNNSILPLQKVDLKDLDEYKSLNVSGRPQFYAISDGKLFWDILPDAVYSMVARYWKKWDIITDQVNWLLLDNPDAYVYGGLSQGGNFIDHPKQQQWDAKFKEILGQIEYQSSKLKKATLRCDPAMVRPRLYDIRRDY